jgi:hypothetical protein
MYLLNDYKLKYKHVAFGHDWPSKLGMWHLNYIMVTYLPSKVVNLVHNVGMTIRKNHPSGSKRWIGKFSTMPDRKFLNYHCFPLHDHFGEFLVRFAHSMVCVM